MTQKHYDLTFHYFRAFAIVSVMLTHMWVGPVLAGSEDAARLQDSLRLCLFHSATIYFVFISGYLFDFVNRRKGPFSPLRFYKSKIVNVFCPYLVLSLLLLAAGWVSHHWFGYDIPFINDGTPVASPGDVLRCLAYGSASLVPYWYIPFIMTVFSAGPLIFHLPTGLLQKILLPAAVLPLLVPRLLVSPLRNLCFFVPIFLMGVYCARNRDACMAFIRRHLGAIRVTAVMSSLLIVADHYFGSFMPNIEGAYYVQKLCIGSWVLDLLEGYAEVHVMTGHTHYAENLIYADRHPGIYEHVHGAVCGAWWQSTINTDGTPNGYAVYRIEGPSIASWKYKGTGLDIGCQIRLYRAGDLFMEGYTPNYRFSYAEEGQIVANVWNADETWKIEVYENGVRTGEMEPFGDDATKRDAWASGYHCGVLGRNPDNYDRTNTSHLFHYTLRNPSAETEVRATDPFGNVYTQSHLTTGSAADYPAYE